MPEYVTAKGEPFSQDQIDAYNLIQDYTGRSLILTGPAGSGKSEVIKKLCRDKPYGICSTTARSALLIGGCTVDSMFCFSRDDWKVWSGAYLEQIMQQTPKKIIIDEASMIGSNMSDLLLAIAKDFDKTLIMVGDWAQAQPVCDSWPFETELFSNSEVMMLETNHRQSVGSYLSGLNDIRTGVLTDHAIEVFQPRITSEIDHSNETVRLFATNKRSESYNRMKLKLHCQERGDLAFGCLTTVQDLTGRMTDAKKTQIIEASRLAHFDSFAIGCRAMIIRNSDKNCTQMFVNGDTGTVVDACYDEGLLEEPVMWSQLGPEERKVVWKTTPEYIKLKLDRGPLISVPKMTIPVTDAIQRVKQQVTGIPLALGYAYTIHKTQGMTIPKVYVSMTSIMDFPDDSRHGMAYVALSRTPDIAGLTLDGLDASQVYCSPAVQGLI